MTHSVPVDADSLLVGAKVFRCTVKGIKVTGRLLGERNVAECHAKSFRPHAGEPNDGRCDLGLRPLLTSDRFTADL